MKKIVSIILIVLVLIALYFGYNYWNSRYNGKVAYAITPTEFPEKKEAISDTGKKISGIYEYKYDLNFVREDGTKQNIPFSITGENPIALPVSTPIKAKISKTLLVEGPTVISYNEIPENIKIQLTN